MSLEKWLRKAKGDGIIQDNPSKGPIKMKEVTEGSSPSKNDYKYFTDKDGYNWVTTPKGLKFPLATRKRGLVGFKKTEPLHTRFGKQYPIVAEWLNRIQNLGTKRVYGIGLLSFCIGSDVSPKDFSNLYKNIEDQTKAKIMVTQYVQTIMNDNPNSALNTIKATKSFFRITSKGFPLPLDTGKGGALYISNSLKEGHEKRRYSYGSNDEMREKLQIMIPVMSRDLKDQTALTLLYRSGVRNGVLPKLKVKDMQDRFIVEGVEVLCLTITGELDSKIKSYNFPRLVDSDGQPRGYYTYLAKDSLELFDKFMDRYHKNSTDDTLLFANYESHHFIVLLSKRINLRLEKAGYPSEEIWLHQLRSCFDTLAHEVLKKNRAEMLAGHLLLGSQEHYQKRNKIECGKDYLQIQFVISTKMLKEKWLKELETKKQLEEERQKKKLETAIPINQIEPGKETFVLGPVPKYCMRDLDFKYAKDNSFCKMCIQTHKVEYQACQELRKERPDLFI